MTDDVNQIRKILESVPKSLNEVYETVQKWLYIPDTHRVDIILAVTLSTMDKKRVAMREKITTLYFVSHCYTKDLKVLIYQIYPIFTILCLNRVTQEHKMPLGVVL